MVPGPQSPFDPATIGGRMLAGEMDPTLRFQDRVGPAGHLAGVENAERSPRVPVINPAVDQHFLRLRLNIGIRRPSQTETIWGSVLRVHGGKLGLDLGSAGRNR